MGRAAAPTAESGRPRMDKLPFRLHGELLQGSAGAARRRHTEVVGLVNERWLRTMAVVHGCATNAEFLRHHAIVAVDPGACRRASGREGRAARLNSATLIHTV